MELSLLIYQLHFILKPVKTYDFPFMHISIFTHNSLFHLSGLKEFCGRGF